MQSGGVAEESWVVVKGYRNYGNALSHIVGSVHSIFEEMSSFLGPVYPTEVRFAVMELFVRRSHRQYAVEALSICDESTEHDREVRAGARCDRTACHRWD